jgi:hypothetical protein
LRTETTLNGPSDFRSNKAIDNLDLERVGQNCALSQDALDRLQKPTKDAVGRRASALRFGDQRVMALLQTLCHFALVASGFRKYASLLPNTPDVAGRFVQR